jgi:hypothetical protein
MGPNARVNRRQPAKRVDVLLNNQLGQFPYCSFCGVALGRLILELYNLNFTCIFA